MLSLIAQGYGFGQIVTFLISSLFVIFCTMPVHEFAHALTAHWLGDDTAKLSGRLTLNPIKHIDVFGAIMILVAGVGFAKPVPVNQFNFKHRKWYMALVALAGPVSNIILALVLLILRNVFVLFGNYVWVYYVVIFLDYAAIINISLAAFNLIPVPPFDGSRVLFAILPDKAYYTVQRYENYIYYAVLALILFGSFTRVFSVPLGYLNDILYGFVNFIANKLFAFV